jgi:ABC-type lipoprotein export system ATPase subunit
MMTQDSDFRIYSFSTINASRQFNYIQSLTADEIFNYNSNIVLGAVSANEYEYAFLGLSNGPNYLTDASANKIIINTFNPTTQILQTKLITNFYGLTLDLVLSITSFTYNNFGGFTNSLIINGGPLFISVINSNSVIEFDWAASNVGSVSYLPQTVAIISGNIAENVALGIPSELIDDVNLRLALKIAALDDWVETLPLRSKTNIGEQGINFSGGQLQRIGIARAVYNRPGLIVLDEPTSSLDEETEGAFLEMLRLLRGQTTFLMITHKLAMLDHVDDVLLLEEAGKKVTARLLDPISDSTLKNKIVLEE